MHAYERIIVERRRNTWKAWFENFPHIAYTDGAIEVALGKLIRNFGEYRLDVDSMILVCERGNGYHLEFAVPLLDRYRIPVPSIN